VFSPRAARGRGPISTCTVPRDAFAATLTSLDDRFSKKWESKAALPGDRIAALKAFHERGVFTWVSIKPTLDIEASIETVRETHGFVDLLAASTAHDQDD
jgi:DNA repair photolyase